MSIESGIQRSFMEPLEEGEIPRVRRSLSFEALTPERIQQYLDAAKSTMEDNKTDTPREGHDGIEDQTSCCICMADFDDTMRVSTMKCGHKFCTDCITENIAAAPSNKCPLCRMDICSEISNPKADELAEELSALEYTLQDKTNTLICTRDAMLYFHDQNEIKQREIILLETDEECYKKELRAVWSALGRVQDKLSKEIAKNGNDSSYKTCGECGKKGHGRGMCSFATKYGYVKHKFTPDSLNYVDTFDIENGYVSYNEILQSVLPGGELFGVIGKHFDQSTDPATFTEDELEGMIQQIRV